MRRGWLLLVAAFGLLVPNGLFVHWLLTGFTSFSDVLENELALAFVIDAAMATVLLAWFFAKRPLGTIRWPWFVVLSLLGGLGFSIPLWIWLAREPAGDDREASPLHGRVD